VSWRPPALIRHASRDTFSRKREKKRAQTLILKFIVLVFIVARAIPARADAIADFYRGKMVHIIVGYDRGGGYDTMAHLIAETLGNYIPGHPLVIVQNMVGAGSMRAASYVAGGAPHDGTIIAATGPAPLFVPFIPPGADTFRLDPQKLNWLPSPASETSVVAVWHTANVKSIDDARHYELPVAANSINGQASFYARLLNLVLGTKFKPILGYQNGTSESLIAMERGEVLAHPSIPLTSLKSERPQWLLDGSVRLIAQYGRAPAEDLPNVPFVDNLLSGENKQVFDIATAPQMIGRPYFMGPNVPPERVAAMRQAFLETFRDTGFRVEARAGYFEIDQNPMTGEDIEALIKSAYAAPPEILARLRELYGAGRE
jgi:tripartite-type tricarboxylate transporter receptor subunit TctC